MIAQQYKRFSVGPFCLAVCILLGTMVGCERLVVSLCAFEDSWRCHYSGTEGIADLPADLDRVSARPPANGPERRFDWRAKVELNQLKKYVGMKGTTAVFENLVFRSSRWLPEWEARTVELSQRGSSSASTLAFPTGFNFSFNTDQRLVSSSSFYLLRFDERKLWSLVSKAEVLGGTELTYSYQPRAFVHPTQDVLVVATKPKSPDMDAVLVQWHAGDVRIYSDIAASSTAFVLGDIDSIGGTATGNEVVFFVGAKAKKLVHQTRYQGQDEDPGLLNGLQAALDRPKTDSSGYPIQAAFVVDLNVDGFTDFVYVRNGHVFVTSYKGRDSSGVGLFEDWKDEPVNPIASDETVRSIAAIDLNGDTYPDLIIETDQAVHFYQNNSIP